MFNKRYRFNLLLRGSIDGFKSSTFLNNCKGKGKTVTIVKDTTGRIFGGYLDMELDGLGTWLMDG